MTVPQTIKYHEIKVKYYILKVTEDAAVVDAKSKKDEHADQDAYAKCKISSKNDVCILFTRCAHLILHVYVRLAIITGKEKSAQCAKRK